MLKFNKTLLWLMGLFLFPAIFLHAYNIESFAPSAFNTNTVAMDESFGISGYAVEDFEDVNLVEGLSIQYTNPGLDPITTLPRTYTPVHPPNHWDGSRALTNHTQNVFSTNPPFSQITTFHIEGGARSFGIGLANFQNLTTHHLLVNGQVIATISNLPGFEFGVFQRNLYLRIDQEDLDQRIFSVSIDEQGANKDGLVFDHVTFDSAGLVPEPSSALLGVITIIFVGITFCRKGQK